MSWHLCLRDTDFWNFLGCLWSGSLSSVFKLEVVVYPIPIGDYVLPSLRCYGSLVGLKRENSVRKQQKRVSDHRESLLAQIGGDQISIPVVATLLFEEKSQVFPKIHRNNCLLLGYLVLETYGTGFILEKWIQLSISATFTIVGVTQITEMGPFYFGFNWSVRVSSLQIFMSTWSLNGS